jgi:LysM repeat protein
MRTWIKSACVVLAWIILPVILMTAGAKGSAHLAQANTRTSSTESILTSILSVAAAPATAMSHTTKYIVQDGDTLSGIATRFAVHGGWPALYAANRQVIGPDPNVVHAGTVLVLPGQMTPIRYTVMAGNTLSAIAAEFAVHGGWPALYAANRQVIGPDPNVVHAGIVLTLPAPATPSSPTPGQTRRQHPRPPQPSPPGNRPALSSADATGRPGRWHAVMAEDRAAGRRDADPGRLRGRAGAAGAPPASAGPGPGSAAQQG